MPSLSIHTYCCVTYLGDAQINGHDINKTAATRIGQNMQTLKSCHHRRPRGSRRSWAHRDREMKLMSPSYSGTVHFDCKLGNQDFNWRKTPGYGEIINVLCGSTEQRNGSQTNIPKNTFGWGHAKKEYRNVQKQNTTIWTQWLGTSSIAQSLGRRIWSPTEAMVIRE
jgi:hypothetical protein